MSLIGNILVRVTITGAFLMICFSVLELS
jgi:hypothetical protein